MTIKHRLFLSNYLSLALSLLFGFAPHFLSAQSAGVVKLRVSNQFGKEALLLNQPFTTLHGDTIELTRFVYYLSNIQLIGKNKTVWKQPESYHLLEVSEEGQSAFDITLDGVPEGEYTEIAFAVGVDSIRNHSGKQVGALDSDNGMFWMWETGYVFLKAEGFFYLQSGRKKSVVYHIGRDDCYQPVRLKMGNKPFLVQKTKATNLVMIADVRQLFGGFPGATIELKAPYIDESVSVMGGPKAPKVARNYARMFSISLQP